MLGLPEVTNPSPSPPAWGPSSLSVEVWQPRPAPHCHQTGEDTHLALLTSGTRWKRPAQ